MSAIRLEGGIVVPVEHSTPPRPMDVLIRGDRIESVTTPGDAAPPSDAERIDCTGRILLPGLVNAHFHPELHLLRGLMEDLSLGEWRSCDRLQRSLDALDDASADLAGRTGYEYVVGHAGKSVAG